jgi:hypothetical protein
VSGVWARSCLSIVDDFKAGPMRRSLTYGMLVLFTLFLITANPSGTGESGRDFVSWLSQGWDDTREFVSTLVGESDETIPAAADQLTEAQRLAQAAVPTVGAAIQNFAPIATPTPLPTPEQGSTVGEPPDPQTQSELGTID